ncbi:hypothetical protein HUU59_11070 [bacterium]|nr:hypothetical protein [bacterium]
MTSIGEHILRYLESRDSSEPLSREQIQELLFEQLQKKIHVRDIQDEIQILNAELKQQGRLVVSGPGRRGYWIPRASERDIQLLEHAANKMKAHAEAEAERAKDMLNHLWDLEQQMKQPVFDSRGQAQMFAQV